MPSRQRSDYRHIRRDAGIASVADQQHRQVDRPFIASIDMAVVAYWRALALPYEKTMAYLGGDLFVRSVTLGYERPVAYGDPLDVGVRCARVGHSSLTFDAAVFRGDELLVDAEIVQVFADVQTQSARPVPQELRAALQDFEAGRPMVDVRVGAWDELGTHAQAIRREVFVDEQRIPADLEWDGADPGCTHAVAFNRMGAPLATGRLLEHVPGVAKIGRMAVSRQMRGTRVGRAVLDALMLAARRQGFREAVLHAQASAAPFYARAGFTERGPRFEEAGIAHVEMMRAL